MQSATSEEHIVEKSLLSILAPFLAGTVLVAVVLVVALLRWAPVLSPTPVDVVSFDVIKYTNSQRAVASAFLRPGAETVEANELLLNLPARTRQAIQDKAGPGTLVVIKQAVVQGQVRDITDEVLTALGMPLNVPTSDATAFALDVAPTMWSLTPPPTPRAPVNTPAPQGPAALP